MRFASIGGSNAASYAAAGKAVADSGAKMFKKQRETGPDYAGLSKVAMQTASNEKIAGMQAEAKLTNVAQKVYADQAQNAYKIKVFETKQDIKAKQRKAGRIAALGKIAGAGFLAATDNTKGRERPKADLRGLYESHKTKRDALKERQNAESDAHGTFTAEPFKPSTGDTPGKVTTGTSASSTSSTSSDKSNYSQNYMTAFGNAGWSSEQAAAMVGHLKVESDNFRADTEYAPNAYGTKGRGHLQWTDTGTSGGRRTNFENYAKKNNLSPTSYEANSGFLLSEMQGNHGNHWTNGGSYQGFLQTTSLQDASAYLQNNYIRPGVPHTDRRLSGAQLALNNYQR
jgi:hypothetical protein